MKYLSKFNLDGTEIYIKDEESRKQISQLKETIENLPSSGSGSISNIYVGSTQPTNGVEYWLDTSVDAPQVNTYSITNNLTNATNDNKSSSINDGESYIANINAITGYILSNVIVTMGGEDITSSVYSNGVINIESVSGDIVITVTATEQTTETIMYSITNALTNVTSDNSAVSVEENTSYTANLTASNGYTLGDVTVTMGGTDITSDVYSNGVIIIPSVTGDVVITASGVEEVVSIPSQAWIENCSTITKTFEGVTRSDDRTTSVYPRVNLEISALESLPDKLYFLSNTANTDNYYWGSPYCQYNNASYGVSQIANCLSRVHFLGKSCYYTCFIIDISVLREHDYSDIRSGSTTVSFSMSQSGRESKWNNPELYITDQEITVDKLKELAGE